MDKEKFSIPGLHLSREDLEVEILQSEDEGKDAELIVTDTRRISHIDFSTEEGQETALEYLDRTSGLPLRETWRYEEPSQLESIKKMSEEAPPLPNLDITDDQFRDKIHGAWLGRTCGCLLGKPVEGWRRGRMWGYLKDSYRWPLSDYFSLEVPAKVKDKYEILPDRPFKESVNFMPEDDDLNYTVTALAMMKKHGTDFTPDDLARFWLENIPVLRTFTAERIAMRNFCLNIGPPESAAFRNPYREWIGAQIRADFYGYVVPGQPDRAAEMAWRDACISHVKNGVFGAMWVAAMISSACLTDDVRTIIREGLARIPEKSRLHEAVTEVMRWRDENVEYDDAVEKIHRLWSEGRHYDWGHVISNAMIVAVGLMWGELNFEKSICRAVQACFDTDCNGATVGSIVGMVVGRKNIPPKWAEPVNDTIETCLPDYRKTTITRLVDETLEVIRKIHG